MLSGEKICLRAIQNGDTDLIFEWWNDLDVVKYFPFYTPATKIQVEQWVDGEMKKANNPLFAICYTPEHAVSPLTYEPIGYCGLRSIEEKDRHAHFKILIGKKEQWGKGYGTDAGQTLIDYGFLYLNLHRVSANCFKPNIASIVMLKKLGFKEEGVRREYAYIAGVWVDYVEHGLLRSEWVKHFNLRHTPVSAYH